MPAARLVGPIVLFFVLLDAQEPFYRLPYPRS
jgi:hypothetical protein